VKPPKQLLPTSNGWATSYDIEYDYSANPNDPNTWPGGTYPKTYVDNDDTLMGDPGVDPQGNLLPGGPIWRTV